MDYILHLVGLLLLVQCIQTVGASNNLYTSRNTKCWAGSSCGYKGSLYSWCYVDAAWHWEFCCTGVCGYQGQGYKWCKSGSRYDFCSEPSYTTSDGRTCISDHPCGSHYYPKSVPHIYWCYIDKEHTKYAPCCPPSYPDCNDDLEED
ncbi:hypothetical protein CHS0354_020720 [Potamilus streckersoni]|uniref:Uncharacterized protein n=1 Tax=Potamilus streckersoni TaxID=2493646 RepID=A0AAE0S7G5_9BIVA|nr:hypothetical protein CHS0354_020720 [Potamilus streckersoni]